jgi:hypothetical protein
MNKCILVIGYMVLAGCSSEAVKSEAVKWVSFGTLVSARPEVESTRHPGRVKSAILGEIELGHTRVETTEGVYIVSDKVGVVQEGVPVTVGYSKKGSSDEYRDTPSYLAFGGNRYEILR